MQPELVPTAFQLSSFACAYLLLVCSFCFHDLSTSPSGLASATCIWFNSVSITLCLARLSVSFADLSCLFRESILASFDCIFLTWVTTSSSWLAPYSYFDQKSLTFSFESPCQRYQQMWIFMWWSDTCSFKGLAQLNGQFSNCNSNKFWLCTSWELAEIFASNTKDQRLRQDQTRMKQDEWWDLWREREID